MNTKGVEDGMSDEKDGGKPMMNVEQAVFMAVQLSNRVRPVAQPSTAVPVEERTQPPMRGNETKAVSDLLNSMKVIDRHQRYQECRSDVLTKLMYELAAFREKAWPVTKPIPEERTAEMEQLLREIHGEHDRNSAYGRCACWACIRIEPLLDHIEGKAK